MDKDGNVDLERLRRDGVIDNLSEKPVKSASVSVSDIAKSNPRLLRELGDIDIDSYGNIRLSKCTP